jgi:hypothetical protein
MSGSCLPRFAMAQRPGRLYSGRRMTAGYAALRTGFSSRRRAETAQPQSRTTPSMAKPRRSSRAEGRRWLWPFGGQPRPPAHRRGSGSPPASQARPPEVLNVRRRQPTLRRIGRPDLLTFEKQTRMIVFARYENRHKESRWTKRPRYSDRMTERQITTPRSSCAAPLNSPPRSGPSPCFQITPRRRGKLTNPATPTKKSLEFFF